MILITADTSSTTVGCRVDSHQAAPKPAWGEVDGVGGRTLPENWRPVFFSLLFWSCLGLTS